MDNEINHLKLEEIIPKNNIPQDKTYDYLQNNLVLSIQNHGIIQPIVVKKNGDKYEIIDGNRRYFAAIKAGLSKIPALVRYDQENVTKLNLREDLYNHDLSPIEEAKKYKEILNNEKVTQEQLAKNLGKSQSALANKLRLLNLPIEIQDALNKEEISERHARSLLSIKNKNLQLELLAKIKEKKLTVRELDSEIKNMSNMFIPEEFSNNNSNNGQTNMFVSQNNMESNSSSNMIMPENNFNNNMMNDSINQNSFMPNNGMNNMMVNNNPNQNNDLNNDMDFNVNGMNQNNMMNNSMMQSNLTPSNGGMNPFFTSNDYVAPNVNSVPNNINQTVPQNPFSSIRMNTNNFNNQNANNDNYNNINDNSNEFDINSYKLPEYENNVDNDQTNNMESNTFNNPIEMPSSIPTNEYKYVEDNPNYVSVDKPDGVSSVDDVIGILRGSLDKIKNGKIRVDTEEIDYDDTYQITIRIDKKGDFL